MPDNLREKYPYSAVFQATAKVVKTSEEKYKTAIASLDKLSGIFGEDSIQRIKNNPDLLYIASKLIELNRVNLNGDCVMAEDIVPYANNFINKFLNIEHSRDNVTGVITDVGFSILGSEDIISEETALNQIDPSAVLIVGGVVWKLINKELCQFIEESSSLEDGKISTSFELLYMSYDIGITQNKDRNAKNAFIVKSGDEDFAKYDKMLKRNGGKGETNTGETVFAILRNVLPVGAGIVANPASGITGILAITSPDQIEKDEDDDEEEDNEQENEKAQLTSAVSIDQSSIVQNDTVVTQIQDASISTDKILTDNNINLQNLSVTANNNIKVITNMELPKIEKVEDITANWAELQKNEAAASAVTDYIKSELEKKSKEFAAEMAKKDELYKQVEANKVESENKVKELTASMEKIASELAEIKAAQAANEAQEIFSNRMAALDEEFDLDDEDRAFLVEEVKVIESDEAFAKYMGKQKKLMAGKKKKCAEKAKCQESDKPGDKEMKTENEEANKCKAAMQEVVASVTEIQNQEISTNPVVQTSLKDQIKEVFAKKTSIGGKKFKK